MTQAGRLNLALFRSLFVASATMLIGYAIRAGAMFVSAMSTVVIQPLVKWWSISMQMTTMVVVGILIVMMIMIRQEFALRYTSPMVVYLGQCFVANVEISDGLSIEYIVIVIRCCCCGGSISSLLDLTRTMVVLLLLTNGSSAFVVITVIAY